MPGLLSWTSLHLTDILPNLNWDRLAISHYLWYTTLYSGAYRASKEGDHDMLALVGILAMVGGIFLCFGVFMILVAKWHGEAMKYRAIARLPKPEIPQPARPQWSIAYKDGKSSKIVIIEAQTEEKAIRQGINQFKIGPRSILSVTRK